MVSTGDIRSALSPVAVLDTYGVRYSRHGRELRTKMCPACGQRSRDAVAVHAETGQWMCHRCTESGDAFTLLALLAELDIRRDFVKVKALAMSIAGISEVLDPETARRTEERIAAEAQRQHRDQAERDRLRANMPTSWEGLDRRSLVGESYLRSRFVHEVGIARFMPNGDPALPLRDLETGVVVGIQHRHVDAKADPKVHTLRASRVVGAALHGRLDELDRQGVDVAVITEGLFDTLVAAIAFDGCAIFGAAGAEHLENIARAVAPRVKAIGGWLLLVPHDDAGGVENMRRARRAAEAVGLKLDRDLLLVDLGEHKDLAEAWALGWRWTWPGDR